MKLTVREAILDLREAFLGRIFKDYPDHKKIWKAEEIAKEFSSVMYDLALDYLERMEKET